MFNRIRQTVSHTDERCVPMSQRHRLPVSARRAVTSRKRVVHRRFASAEAL